VAAKHTLHDANIITLMNRKHRYVALRKIICLDGITMVAIMLSTIVLLQ